MKCPRCSEDTALWEMEVEAQDKIRVMICAKCKEDWRRAESELFSVARRLGSDRPDRERKSFLVKTFMNSTPSPDRGTTARTCALLAHTIATGEAPGKIPLDAICENSEIVTDEDYAWLAGVMDALPQRMIDKVVLPSGVSKAVQELSGTHSPWKKSDPHFHRRIAPFLACHRGYVENLVSGSSELPMEPCEWHPEEFSEVETTHAYLAGVFDVMGTTHESGFARLSSVQAFVKSIECRWFPSAFEAMYGGDVVDDGPALVWAVTGDTLREFLQMCFPYFRSEHQASFAHISDFSMPGDSPNKINILARVRSKQNVQVDVKCDMSTLPPIARTRNRPVPTSKASKAPPKGEPAVIRLTDDEACAVKEGSTSCHLCDKVLDMKEGALRESGGMSVLAKVKHLAVCVGIVFNLECPVCSKTSPASTWESKTLSICPRCQKKGG